MTRALPLALLAAACLPALTDLAGKACDDAHPCGRGLFCVEGACASSPAANGGGGAAGGAGTAGANAGGASSCDGGSEDCTNGRDDDCDGLRDCADSDCEARSCSSSNRAAVCCGTSCRDLSADANHCGSCAAACAAGESCRLVMDGPVVTGRCTCNGSGGCPSDQDCRANVCSCDEDDECNGGDCRLLNGSGSAGICHY